MTIPVFVVTGAQNKGKSTLVKAMTNDETIIVSEKAGETKRSKSYPMSVDGKVLYTLWDTPGFQNAKQLCELLSSWGIETSSEPLELYRSFIDEYQNNEEFEFEIEIFRPIINNACIVYIADCSKPYSKACYHWEIQLIKWTRLPRIAILNPIEGDEYLNSWEQNLLDHFNFIDKFNPYNTSFKNKLDLLDSFSGIKKEWKDNIKKAVTELKREREEVLEKSALVIRTALLKVYKNDYQVIKDEFKDKEQHAELLLSQIKADVKSILTESQKEIVSYFGFDTNTILMNSELNKNDVFEENVLKEYMSRKQQAWISALVGAMIGAIADLSVGEATFGAFMVVLGAVGFARGFLKDPHKLLTRNFKDIYNEGNVYRIKYIDVMLGYLIINRLRNVVHELYNKTAVNTDTIEIDYNYDKRTTIELTHVLSRISKEGRKGYSDKNLKKLKEIILNQLKEDNNDVLYI